MHGERLSKNLSFSLSIVEVQKGSEQASIFLRFCVMMHCTASVAVFIIALVAMFISLSDGQTSVFGPPSTNGAYIARALCIRMGQIPWNVWPCSGGPGSVQCIESDTLCSSNKGICVSPEEEGHDYRCKLCGGIPQPLGTYSGVCQHQSDLSLNNLLRQSIKPFYYIYPSSVEPQRAVQFLKFTTTVRANRIDKTMLADPFATVLVDYYDGKSSERCVKDVLTVGVGIQLHESHEGNYNYLLDSVLLQRKATPSATNRYPSLKTSLEFPSQEWNRINSSTLLAVQTSSSNAQQLLLGPTISLNPATTRRSFVVSQLVSQRWVKPTKFDSSSEEIFASFSDTLVDEMGAGISPFANASTSFGIVRNAIRETVEVMSVGGTPPMMEFTSLHFRFNVFATGKNPFNSIFFWAPQTNFHSKLSPVLIPIRIKAKQLLVDSPGVYPIATEFVANIAQIISLSNGEIRVLPIYIDQTEELQVSAGQTAQELLSSSTEDAILKFNSAPRQTLFEVIESSINAAPTTKIVNFYSSETQSRKCAMYVPGTRLVRWFGSNFYGEFGTGAGTVNTTFDGSATSTITLAGADADEYIQKIALGESHTLILTTKGNVFVAGDTTNSSSDCNNGTMSGATFSKIESMTNVADVGAGWDFSVFVRGDNATVVTVCGGAGYLTDDGGLEDVVKGWTEGVTSISSLCTGMYYICASSVSSADESSSSSSQPLLDVFCFGSQDTLRGSHGTKFSNDPRQSTQICGTNNDFSYYKAERVEKVLCGSHHVGFLMRTRNNIRAQNTDLFPDFLEVFQCGSNSNGQLGANFRLQVEAVGGIYPLPSVSERIFSTRPPNEYLLRNNDDDWTGVDASSSSNYQLFETVGLSIFENTTFVFTKLKSFNTPDYFLSNMSRFVGQYPPDGHYSLFALFADMMRDINATTSQLTDSANSWWVSFSLIKGLSAFLVSNQTSASEWVTYTDSDDGTQPPMSNTTADLIASSGSFFRNWRRLMRNATSNESSSSVTMTIAIPSLFVATSSGRVYPLNALSSSCTPAGSSGIYYCDEASKKVIWGHALAPAGVPAGYTHIIDGSMTTWVALYVSIASQNVSGAVVDGGNSSSSLAEEVIAEQLRVARDGSFQLASTKESFYCYPSVSVYDCSSLRWFETFLPIDTSSAKGASYSPILSAATMAAIQSLTQTTTSGYVRNGVAATTMGQRLTPSSTAGATRTSGIVSLELFGVHYNEQSIKEGNLFLVCIYVKIGRMSYFLQLLADGKIVRCGGDFTHTPSKTHSQSESMVSFSQTLSVPEPTGTPPPTPPPLQPPPPTRWFVDNQDYLSLTSLDPHNNFQRMNGTMVDPTITFALSCAGGLALRSGSTGDTYDTHSYVLLTNSSQLQRLLLQQRRDGGKIGWEDSSLWYHSPMGCDGGFFVPVSPMAPHFDAFQFMLRSNTTIVDDLVVEMDNYHVAASQKLSFVIRVDGIQVRVKTQSLFDVDSATSENIADLDITKADSELLSITIDGNWWSNSATIQLSSKFYCLKKYVADSRWIRFLLVHMADQNRTQIYLDDELVCDGSLLDPSVHLINTTGIYFGARNHKARLTNFFNVREIALCDSDADSNPGSSIFPCTASRRIFARVKQTSTRSLSLSPTLTTVQSISDSLSSSPTFSPSSTISQSASASSSKSISHSVSISTSLTPSDSLTSIPSVTASHGETESVSLSLEKDIYLSLGQVDITTLTVHTIRRAGMILVLHLRDDVFDFRVDFATKFIHYVDINSTVSASENPVGFLGRMANPEFIHAAMNPLNASQLHVFLGPDLLYNSFCDETITLSVRSSAVGSKFFVPGIVEFTISGRGFVIDRSLHVVELVNGVAAIAAAVSGGFPAAVTYAGTFSITMNFHCFNSEKYPIGFIVSLFQVEIVNDEFLGAFVSMGAIIIGITLIHLAVVYIVRFRAISRVTFHAMAHVHFPSLTVVTVFLFVPAWVWSAIQYAERRKTAGAFALISIMPIFVGGAFIYLIGQLYDEASFGAVFIPADEDTVRSLKATQKWWSYFMLPGRWESTDRKYSFYGRFMFLMKWLTPRRSYWSVVEIAYGVMLAVVSSITNNHPVTCIAQYILMLTLTAAIFTSTLLTHPFQTQVIYSFSLIFHFLTSAVSVTKIIDIVKGETRLIERMLFVSYMSILCTFTACSICATIAAVRSIFLVWQYKKLIAAAGSATERAPPIMLSEKLLPDAASSLGDTLTEMKNMPTVVVADTPEQRDASAAQQYSPQRGVNSQSPAKAQQPKQMGMESLLNYSFQLPLQHMKCKIDLPDEEGEQFGLIPSVASFHPGDDVDGSGKLKRATSSLRRHRTVSLRAHSSVKHSHLPQQQPQPVDKRRDFFRLLALEQVTGEPAEPVAYDPAEDELL